MSTTATLTYTFISAKRESRQYLSLLPTSRHPTINPNCLDQGTQDEIANKLGDAANAPWRKAEPKWTTSATIPESTVIFSAWQALQVLDDHPYFVGWWLSERDCYFGIYDYETTNKHYQFICLRWITVHPPTSWKTWKEFLHSQVYLLYSLKFGPVYLYWKKSSPTSLTSWKLLENLNP